MAKKDELNFETDNKMASSEKLKAFTGCHGKDRKELSVKVLS